MKITDDLYAFEWKGYENNCNSYFFGGSLGVFIDVGHLRFADHLFDRLQAAGIMPEDIRLAIVTHSHPDHMEAVPRFTELGIPIAMHPQALEYLEVAGAAIYQWLDSELPNTNGIVPIDEGPVALTEGALEVFHTPGHEPGSLCVYWAERRALATGDLIFAGGVGRTDFPGGEHGKLMAGIERMGKFEIDYLLPGHGPIITGFNEVQRNFTAVRRMFG
ncbi:MAG: MBL fold metallo-hydrolase [Candidatus Zipacnadales bacterium]